MHNSASMQFDGGSHPLNDREVNSPIVLNSAAVFASAADRDAAPANNQPDLMNTGIASPDSVNYNFGN